MMSTLHRWPKYRRVRNAGHRLRRIARPARTAVSLQRRAGACSLRRAGAVCSPSGTVGGRYHAEDYAHLNVPADVRQLFEYIEAYEPEVHGVLMGPRARVLI
jgi:hypothetical protein